jgi:translation elongation factor EF-Ts
MTKTQKLEELIKRTGKSKMACDIALQLAGNDIEKAIERMRISYPSMKVEGDNDQ